MEGAPIDLRGLEPPEPLMRVLDAVGEGGEGPWVFLLSREPLPLYALLGAWGCAHAARHDERGVELTVFRRPRGEL